MRELAISIGVNVVLGGILLVLLRWRHLGDTVPLEGPAAAMSLFKTYFPEAVGEATLSDDRRSALIDLQRGGGIGLLQRQGRRWNARTLMPGEVSSVALAGDGTVKLKFADFGWPRAQLRITDADARAFWMGRLSSLRAQARRHPGLRHA